MRRPSSRQLRELPARRIGLIGIGVILTLLAVSLNVGRLQTLFGEQERTALLTESGGLRSGDSVEVNGVPVGRVRSVDLGSRYVEVSFTTSDISVGRDSTAVVKSANALGRKYLALTPKGSGDIDTIDADHTDPGFAVNERLGDLTRTVGAIDTDQLAASMRSISTVLDRTPQEFRNAVAGVGRLSRTIADRDTQLASLLSSASQVSSVLARRNQEIAAIMSDGSAFLDELQMRRSVVEALLVNIRKAAEQLEGLADDNARTLGPALRDLRSAGRILADNRDSIAFTLKNLGGFVRGLGEAIGSGPFFMAYLQNVNGANFVPSFSNLPAKGSR